MAKHTELAGQAEVGHGAVHPVGEIVTRRIGTVDGRGEFKNPGRLHELADRMKWRTGGVFALPEEGLLETVDGHDEGELADVAEGEAVLGQRDQSNPRTGD